MRGGRILPRRKPRRGKDPEAREEMSTVPELQHGKLRETADCRPPERPAQRLTAL